MIGLPLQAQFGRSVAVHRAGDADEHEGAEQGEQPRADRPFGDAGGGRTATAAAGMSRAIATATNRLFP